MTSAAILSEQTQRDLKCILETLDQRIHEIGSFPAARETELADLKDIRSRTASLLGVC